jgi:hypothetical protein
MNCLTNRIGITGGSTTEASGEGVTPVVEALPILLVNHLPGISVDNITALVDSEQADLITLWNEVVVRTMKKFEILVKAKLNQCYKLTDKTIVACLVCEKKELFDVALWYLHGCELMIERTSSDELSRFTTIDLEKAEKLKADFYDEFQAALNDAVQAINPSDSDCLTTCVECNNAVKWVMQTP